MGKTPCELMLWNHLPAIRKELAVALINDHGLSQRDAAEKLGVTPAAVCQYLAKKRGQQLTITTSIKQEIGISAARIKNNGSATIETCRLCRLIQSQMTPLTPADEPEQ